MTISQVHLDIVGRAAATNIWVDYIKFRLYGFLRAGIQDKWRLSQELRPPQYQILEDTAISEKDVLQRNFVWLGKYARI